MKFIHKSQKLSYPITIVVFKGILTTIIKKKKYVTL